MRTKEKLIKLSNKNESWIYKEMAKALSKKLFISKLQIRIIRYIPDFKYNLYEDMLKDFTTKQYFYCYQDEIKNTLIQEFWGLYKFNLANTNWKLDAITFVLTYNLNKIIKDI